MNKIILCRYSKLNREKLIYDYYLLPTNTYLLN